MSPVTSTPTSLSSAVRASSSACPYPWVLEVGGVFGGEQRENLGPVDANCGAHARVTGRTAFARERSPFRTSPPSTAPQPRERGLCWWLAGSRSCLPPAYAGDDLPDQPRDCAWGDHHWCFSTCGSLRVIVPAMVSSRSHSASGPITPFASANMTSSALVSSCSFRMM